MTQAQEANAEIIKTLKTGKAPAAEVPAVKQSTDLTTASADAAASNWGAIG
jgi:hypothetical protein